MSGIRGELPGFHFHTVDLYRAPAAHAQDLFQETIASDISRAALGTQIWWATTHTGEARCLKEFYLANPAHFGRTLPDPIWRSPAADRVPTGAERGLAPTRAALFDRMQAGTLKQEVARAGGHHSDFRSQFNAYSFEVESLITQFAQHYQCDQLVKTYYWGPLSLPSRRTPHYTIEMERLQPLPLPPIGDYLAIAHRLIQMMSATVQLHSMLIPIRSYPPELISDINIARRHPITRPFHYDLSPDQFMSRTLAPMEPEQVVLIDFNASRTAKAEYSDFSWRTIPGKDYYQPPERRAHQTTNTDSIVFQSNPVYDLYSLLIIGLFMLVRQEDWQQRIQQIKGWDSLQAFYKELFSPQLATTLQARIPSNRGIQAKSLIALMQATFQDDPSDRYTRLMGVPGLGWRGLKDWMLLPRAMNVLAREVMGRQFEVTWRSSTLTLTEGEAPVSLLSLLLPEGTRWRPGRYEEGRIDHLPFAPERLFFLQAEDVYPLVRGGQIEPRQAGRYTIYAAWGGCVDFAHPLTIEVRPSTHAEVSTNAPRPAHVEDPYTKLQLQSVPPAGAPTAPELPSYQGAQKQPPLTQDSPPREPSYTEVTPSMVLGPATEPPASHPPVAVANKASRSPSGPHETVDFDRAVHGPLLRQGNATHASPAHLARAREPQAIEAHAAQIAVQQPARDDAQDFHRQTLPSASISFPGVPDPTSHSLESPPPTNALTEAIAEAVPDDLPENQLPPPTPSQLGSRPDLTQWLVEIERCDDQQRLSFMEAFLRNEEREGLVLTVLVNICTRRCQLQLEQGSLQPGSPSLQHLSELLVHVPRGDVRGGVLLNNLAICCYQSAWERSPKHRWPDWEELLGWDPVQRLRQWLNQTDPATQSPTSTRIWEIRERSRETIEYCRKMRRGKRT